MTQSELANFLNVSLRSVTLWEKGSVEISDKKKRLFQELLEKKSPLPTSNYSIEKNLTEKSQNRKVFIVHGHDELAMNQLARFLLKLNFEPIVLHEQASQGSTIIEKIEEYSDVGYAVVLYTPCDFGGKLGSEGNPNSRARQNVVFEHGYLIAKVGRKNVSALVKGKVETPGDISGVVYIKMESDSWQVQLAKELRASGFEVDMNLFF